MIRFDGDVPEIAAIEIALVGDCADDRTRPHFMSLAHRDPVGGQVVAGPPRRPFAVRLIVAFEAFRNRRRFSQQELRTIAGLQCQCGGDIAHRDVVVALVVLDKTAEHFEPGSPESVGDRVAEPRNPLGVHVFDGGKLRLDDLLSGHFLYRLQQMPFSGRDEQQRVSRAARATGTADAMHVGLRVVRNVVVEHMRDAFDVKASGGDVGGDQDIDTLRSTTFQRSDRTLALHLRDITVDRCGGKPTSTQLFSHLLGSLLRSHEHDHRLKRLDLEDTGQGIHLPRPGHQDVALGDVLSGGGFRLDRHFHRVVQILSGDLADRGGHGGREQRDLLVLWSVGENALDIFGETHLQHLVGFVEDEVVQMREIQGATFEVIDDAARCADHDVRSAPQAGQLHGVGLAAIDRQHGDPRQMRPVPAEGLGNLQSQFAGRGQHQRLGVLAGGVDARQDRDGERRGLSGAGLGEADHVGTGQQGRDGGRLDG